MFFRFRSSFSYVVRLSISVSVSGTEIISEGTKHADIECSTAEEKHKLWFFSVC